MGDWGISAREDDMKEWDWMDVEMKNKWIYESPDGGNTVTRRRFFAENSERVIIMENGKELEKKDQRPFYDWSK